MFPIVAQFWEAIISSSLQQDQGETSGSQSPNSSVQISNIDSEVIDSTPLRWKSISEVYERCNVCIVELECFIEATTYESWNKAMQDELNMIEKINTWELVRRSFDKPVICVK